PPGQRWQTVSPQLRALRRLILSVVLGVVGPLSAVLAGVLVAWWLAVVVLAVAVVVFAWGWWLIDRNWRSWGYAERGDGLLVTHGVLFRRLVVVPYGRMQFVDVTAG